MNITVDITEILKDFKKVLRTLVSKKIRQLRLNGKLVCS